MIEMVGFAINAHGSQQVPEGLPIKLPTVGDFLALLASSNSADLMQRTIAVARGSVTHMPVYRLDVLLGLERLLPVLKRSDHVRFWNAKIPAVLWTDTAEFRNPHRHKLSDTPATMNYEFLHSEFRVLAAAILAPRRENCSSRRSSL